MAARAGERQKPGATRFTLIKLSAVHRHRDGDLLRCTFTLNDLPPSPEGGGTVVLPGSHRGGMVDEAGRLADTFGAILNSEHIQRTQQMPYNMSQTGPAGSFMINWCART